MSTYLECSRDFLSTCGERRNTVDALSLVGSVTMGLPHYDRPVSPDRFHNFTG
jgi:hypothetical protein